MPLRFSNKQSRRGSDSRDSKSGATSVFEKVIMLGVFSRMWVKVGRSCQPVLPQNTEVDTHRDFPVVKQWCCSFTLVGNSRVAGPSKFMCLNFVRDLWQSYLWYPRSWCCVWKVVYLQNPESGASSESGKWCHFDFWASNHIGSVFSMWVKVGHFCQSTLPRSTEVDTHWNFLVIK